MLQTAWRGFFEQTLKPRKAEIQSLETYARQRHHCVQLNQEGKRTAAAPLRAAQPGRGAHSSGTTACSSAPQGSAQQRYHCVQLNPSGERTAAAPLRAAQPGRGAHSSGTTACSSTPKGSALQRHHCLQLNPEWERTAAAPLRAAQPGRGAHSSGITACSSTPQGSAQQRHGANAEVSAQSHVRVAAAVRVRRRLGAFAPQRLVCRVRRGGRAAALGPCPCGCACCAAEPEQAGPPRLVCHGAASRVLLQRLRPARTHPNKLAGTKPQPEP